MNAHIIHDGKGRILSLNRTVDGAAHFLAGHGSNARIAGEDLTIDGLGRALSESPVITVSFSDAEDLVVERHAVLV